MCSSNEASELLAHPTCLSYIAPANSCLAIQPRWGHIGGAHFLPFPLLRQSHTPSIINVQRGVAFISIPLPNDILRATFVEANRRKNAFNYLLPKILALSDCFCFPLSLFHPLHLAMVGWCHSPNTISSGYLTGKFVRSHHIYRFVGSPRSLLFSAVDSKLPAFAQKRDRYVLLNTGCGHWCGAENLWFHSVYFHSFAKVALGTPSCSDLIWLTSVSSVRRDAARVF